ncbi:MAG: hypothetical protein IJ287_04150 [Methanobrevibacter sp.]|nr:hypothetical protein [Methanobrevibacter sp.]
MKIVTTPMCEEIVKLAGIHDYIVNKFPDEEDGDLAILLSESKVEMDSLPIKINTPKQVFESIKKVSKITGNELSDMDVQRYFDEYHLAKKYLNSNFKRNVNVKVYSEFLKDIASDFGFDIVSVDFDYVIYPDYLKDSVEETENLVEIPSHNCISKNPFEKIEVRYAILETLI